MCMVNKQNFLQSKQSLSKYHKVEYIHPKGLIFSQNHLWRKEHHISPYPFEYKNSSNIVKYSIWW